MDILMISFEIALRWMPQEINIGLGNGLVPLASVNPDLCCHMASQGHNKLTKSQ